MEQVGLPASEGLFARRSTRYLFGSGAVRDEKDRGRSVWRVRQTMPEQSKVVEVLGGDVDDVPAGGGKNVRDSPPEDGNFGGR